MADPPLPDLAALGMLRAVSRLGSAAAAGRQLGLSQQAVSARMRTLERQVGVPLLIRTPGGSQLTGDGELVLGWAEELLAAADRLQAGLLSMRTDLADHLAVAASQTIAESLLPHWLVMLRLREEADHVSPTEVTLTVANSSHVIQMVRHQEASVGFIETPHVPRDLASAPLRTDELVTVVAPTHPWARRQHPLNLTELAATPLVMRESGSGTREAFADILTQHSPPLQAHPAVELGTSAAVRSAIAAGIAPGVISRLAVRDDLVLGRLVTVEVEGPPLERPLTAVWLRRPTPTSPLLRLLETCAAHQSGPR